MRGVVTSQNMTATMTTTAMTSGPIPATMSRALKLVLMNAMMRNQRGIEIILFYLFFFKIFYTFFGTFSSRN